MKMASYIGSLLDSKHPVHGVLSQSDDVIAPLAKNNKIGSNQCSWCAAEFIIKKSELVQSLGNRHEYQRVYNSCIIEGSVQRGLHGYLTYGENINNPKILERVSQFDTLHVVYKPNGDFLNLLPAELATEFYSGNSVDDIFQTINYVLGRSQRFMVSRYGLSFAVIALTHDLYLVCDSHTHESGVMNRENLIRYILMDEPNVFYGTFVLCI